MTLDEMESLLDRLGVEYVGSRGVEIQGYCPGHIQRTGHADRNPSWYINAETGAHICFSCGFKGGVMFLVCFVNGFYSADNLDMDKAKEWMGTEGQLSEAFEKAINKPKEVFQEVTYITEAALAAFTEPPDHALKARGLTREAARHFGLLWDTRRDLWIITIRDPHTGKLLGWQEKAFSGRFFRNYPTGIKKSVSLYGWDKYEGGDLIVVESPLDVVRMASVGILGGVATYGSILSKEQLALLKTADKLIFALDSDEAGIHSSLDILDKTRTDKFECWFFDYSNTDMKDVGGMSKQEIVTGLANARHSTRYASWAVV